MTLAVLTLTALVVAAYALHHVARPHAVSQLDPYTVWMVRHLPGKNPRRR